MSNTLNRRECLRQGVAGMFASAALGTGASKLSAAEEESLQPVRLGVIGLGGRGRYLLQCLASNYPGVTVTALCDLIPDRLQQGIGIVKKIKGTSPAGYCSGWALTTATVSPTATR
jgi:hypothetical protein